MLPIFSCWIHSLIGSEGRISWNYLSGELKISQTAAQPWEFYTLTEGFSRNDLFLEEMQHFLQVAAGKAPPLCSLDDGIKVQKIIAALYQAVEDGTSVSIL